MRLLIALILSIFCAPVLAQDSLFNLTGTFADGGTVTGSFMVDTTTGALDSGSVTIADVGASLASYDGLYAPVGGQWYANQTGAIDFVKANTTESFMVSLPGGSVYRGQGLIGYNGQTITGAGLDDGAGIVDTLLSGSIVDPPNVSASVSAPEINANQAAGALTLLAGGLLVLCGKPKNRKIWRDWK